MATAWTALYRVGTGWTYNDTNITYNQTVQIQTGSPILYNGTGESTQWTNLAKP